MVSFIAGVDLWENLLKRVVKLARVNIDNMEGHDFEYWCADLLRGNGFTGVSVTRGSGDQGVDVLAEKDGQRYAIQCKRYSSKLGNTPIQEVYTGKAIYNCQIAVVMTNNYFTSGAIEAARATGVLLWDRDKLLSMSRNNQPKIIRNTPTNRQTIINNRTQLNESALKPGKHLKAAILILSILFGVIIAFQNIDKSKSSASDVNHPVYDVADEVEKDFESSKKEIENSIWANEYTPLEQFDYFIEDGAIIIDKYIGEQDTMWIAPSYEIDNTLYPVVMVNGCIGIAYGASTHVKMKSIVISEGIPKIAHNIFNLSDFEYIYIPSTIEDAMIARNAVSFLHSKVNLYFGGTQEEWGTDYDASLYENVHIYYNCSFANGEVSVEGKPSSGTVIS